MLPSRALPPLLLLIAAGMWCWLAFAVHTVEIVGGELDQYVVRARAILAGSDNHDPYHPAGYPLWLAAIASCGPDPFTAARGLGVLSGLVLTWASYRTARLWLPTGTSLLCALSVAVSEFTLVVAVQACSDVPAAAAIAVALWLWCRAAITGVTTRGLLLAGLAFGIAISFRSPSAWFAGAFVPLLFGCSWRQRARRLLLTTAATTLGLLPHLLWYWHVFGSPFHNLSWHNLVLKFHHRFDVPAWVADIPNFATIVRAEWTSWLQPAAVDVAAFLAGGLGAGLGLISGTLLATLVSLAVLGGHGHAARQRDRARTMLALGSLPYAMLLAATFQPIDRFTIPLVLPAVLALVLPLRGAADRRSPWALVMAAVLAAAVSWNAIGTIDLFRRCHPHAELAAVDALRHEFGEPVRALVRPFYRCSGADPFADLRRELHAHDQEFLVLARANAAEACAAFTTAPLPGDFRIVRDDDVLVLDASALPTPWLAAASALPDGDVIRLQLSTHGAVADDPILLGAFLLVAHGEHGPEWHHLALAPTGERAFALELPRSPLRGKRCRFVPAVIHASGMIRRGAPIEVTP
jgi:hypothetical protein